MAVNIPGLTLNGFVTSWNKCTITFGNTTQLPSIKSLDYGIKIDYEAQFGAGQFSYGRTDGNWVPDDIKLSITPADALKLYTGLGGKAAALDDTSTFDMRVQYCVDPAFVVVYTDVLYACRMKNYVPKLEQNKASYIEITLSALDIDIATGTNLFLNDTNSVNEDRGNGLPPTL